MSDCKLEILNGVYKLDSSKSTPYIDCGGRRGRGYAGWLVVWGVELEVRDGGGGGGRNLRGKNVSGTIGGPS